MTVSRRLLIVALLCMLPTVAAGLFTQFDLQGRRTVELGELALRQAHQARTDLFSLIESARQLGEVAIRFPDVGTLGPGCTQQLSALHRGTPRYSFLAAYRADGSLACASAPISNDVNPGWLNEAVRNEIGGLARHSGVDRPFLPVALPILDSTGRRRGSLIVALDADRIQSRHRDPVPGPALASDHTNLVIADRADRILNEPGAANDPAGMLSVRERELARESAPGIATVPGEDGKPMLAAYIPRASPADPVYVRVGLSLNAATAEIDNIALRGAMMVGSASLISLVLALAAGEAFIRLPTERLLATAQRWRDGDLAARAVTREETSEFGRLGAAFNEMAASLEQRAAERERAAQLLEQRVAERTAALSESNARLHVEIAEREKTEAALAQAQKLQAVGRLAGGIAHDFNNLLATVLGNLELLERRIEPSQERLHTLISRAMGAVQRGAQLTSRLLAFSRRHRTVTRAIDVNKAVADLVTLASSTLGRRIEVSTHFATDVWPAIADPSQLEAALLNLALNARDAMPQGGKLMIATENETLTAPADGAPAGDYVRIDVVDNGAGMAPDVLARAFEPFFTTKGPGGSGLGLSQVYGIAQQFGGTVRLRSKPGHGTMVSILLPRTTMDQEPVDPTRARRRITLPLTVLVVDDDLPVRLATADMLREMGCKVLEAGGGEEAMRVLRSQESRDLGLLVVDYAMPGLTGLQVAVAARNMGFQVPVLLITGYAEFGEPDEPGADVLDAVLHKPFSAADLEATLVRMGEKQTPAES